MAETLEAMKERLGRVRQEEAERGEPMFMGIPDRWYEAGLWRCPNGHVSRVYLKSEGLGGAVCLAGGCAEPVMLTFPEDVEVPCG